jgi:hypothetical protein
MPNGVVLALSPHLSVWDQCLANECDEAVWADAAAAAAAPVALQSEDRQQQQQQGFGADFEPVNGTGLSGVDTSNGRAGSPLSGEGGEALSPAAAAAAAVAGAGVAPQQGSSSSSQPKQEVWAAAAAAVVASNAQPSTPSHETFSLRAVPDPESKSNSDAPDAAVRPGEEGAGVWSKGVVPGQAQNGNQHPVGGALQLAEVQQLQQQQAGKPAEGCTQAQAQAAAAAALQLKALQGLQVCVSVCVRFSCEHCSIGIAAGAINASKKCWTLPCSCTAFLASAKLHSCT